MNCKPDELCRIVNCGTTIEANDHFVTTVKLVDANYITVDRYGISLVDDGPVWLVQGHSIPWRLNTGRLVLVSERCIGDAFLRPIRPPPDDARDEMLRPLPTSINTKEYV